MEKFENKKQGTDGRREIASRDTNWARAIARKLTDWGAKPNHISIMSIVFSVLGCSILLSSIYFGLNKCAAYILFPVCIGLRLLCNLFDGMVAVEGGKGGPNGDLYNDVPDRFDDVLLIVPAGYVAGGIGVELGWLAAILAVMTAYFRWMGAFKTKRHFFNGPQAKSHRMALLSATSLAAAVALCWGYDGIVFLVGLAIMNIGVAITLIYRLYLITHIDQK